MRFVRNIRRFSYSPPKGAGENDSSSFFTILGIAAAVGGIVQLYRDPDILPDVVKQYLPIQQQKGQAMSLEEYEQWRAKQTGYPDELSKITKPTNTPQVSEKQKDVEDEASLTVADDIPIPHGDVSPLEMKLSLQKLLTEARENEAGYIADIKKSRAPPTEEDRQMLQAFKDEKARLKKQLKFIKSSK